jgi:glutathione S-transferase
MKLYYVPGACSLSCHISLREAGLKFDLDKIDVHTRRTGAGKDYFAINPKGYVPALKIDDKTLLTECSAILQFIADQTPTTSLAPAPASMDRYRLQEWLSFVSSELHSGFSALFDPDTPAAYRTIAIRRLTTRFDLLEQHLSAVPYLMGDRFTVADAYCYTVLGWARIQKLSLSPWKSVLTYLSRIAERPHVQAALMAEGLVDRPGIAAVR